MPAATNTPRSLLTLVACRRVEHGVSAAKRLPAFSFCYPAARKQRKNYTELVIHIFGLPSTLPPPTPSLVDTFIHLLPFLNGSNRLCWTFSVSLSLSPSLSLCLSLSLSLSLCVVFCRYVPHVRKTFKINVLPVPSSSRFF